MRLLSSIKWISVDDYLPNPYFSCLLCDRFGAISYGFITPDSEFKGDHRDDYSLSNITHWIPLESIPKP